MCSCANESVHVGPISTFDLNNSNSGVAQISNRACLWSRVQSGLKLLVIDDTDHMYLPAPSFSKCFSYSAGWDEMNRKLAVVVLLVGWKHVFKAEIIGSQQISWFFQTGLLLATMAAFTKEQWLTIITFVIVNFCNAMCVSMQVTTYIVTSEKSLLTKDIFVRHRSTHERLLARDSKFGTLVSFSAPLRSPCSSSAP